MKPSFILFQNIQLFCTSCCVCRKKIMFTLPYKFIICFPPKPLIRNLHHTMQKKKNIRLFVPSFQLFLVFPNLQLFNHIRYVWWTYFFTTVPYTACLTFLISVLKIVYSFVWPWMIQSIFCIVVNRFELLVNAYLNLPKGQSESCWNKQ